MPAWGVIPSIRVTDIDRVIAFYTDTLGFELLRNMPEEGNFAVGRDDSRLMIEVASAGFYSPAYNEAIAERAGTPSATALYMEAKDLDELYARVNAEGVTVVDPLAERPWGQFEFTIADPEGNWLTFWRSIEGHGDA